MGGTMSKYPLVHQLVTDPHKPSPYHDMWALIEFSPEQATGKIVPVDALVIERDRIEAFRNLVATWRERAKDPGSGDFYIGREQAYDVAADELDALIAEQEEV
jgi:hypothetical protein